MKKSCDRILFVHSLGTNGKLWNDVVSHLPSKFEAILPDMPMHGNGPQIPFSIDVAASHLVSVMDRSMPEYVVGISMGGPIIVRALSRCCKQPKGIVLINTFAYQGPEGIERSQRACDQIGEYGLSKFAIDYAKSVIDYGEKHLAFEYVLDAIASIDEEAFKKAIISVFSIDVRKDLMGLTPSAFVISSSEDNRTPPAMGRELADSIPNAVFVLHKGVGHLSPLEEPERLSGLIHNFCDSL